MTRSLVGTRDSWGSHLLVKKCEVRSNWSEVAMVARLAPGEGRADSPKVKTLHHRPSRELAVQGSSPVGVASLMGAASLMGTVGGLIDGAPEPG
jgi:hypothetical protein